MFGGPGPATRTESVRALAGDLLPAEVVARRGKASFNEAFITHRARSFARDWDGEGLTPAVSELVDADALRAVWAADDTDGRAFLLLQAVWLHQRGHEMAERQLES